MTRFSCNASTMPCRSFDFRVNSGLSTGRIIEFLDEFNFFGQRMHTKMPRLCRISLRIDGRTVCVHALPRVQRAQLNKIEIPGIVAVIVAPAPGKLRRYVGDPVQANIVQDDKLVVSCCDNILFDVIRTHRVGHCFGRQCVLGQVSRGSAVGDDQRHNFIIYIRNII